MRGDWMQTYTGVRFYPLDPRAEEIDPRDIAHALSLLCRYGGHVDRFYSVAEHCVLMAEAVPPEYALAALLHDATEAYVCDVPRPLKRQLAGYREIEDNVWLAIASRFGVDPAVPSIVKEADNRILLTERDALMPNTRYSWSVDGMEPLPVTVAGWPPEIAEVRYLATLRRLLGTASELADRRHNGKVVYGSERSANRAAARARARTRHAIYPYLCGRHWHIGHNAAVETEDES